MPALVLTVPILGFHGFAAGILQLGPQTLSDAGWTIVFARSALPFGFLLAIALASLFASGALKRLIGEIGSNPDAARLQQIVATALDDPSVELVFNVDGALADSRGRATNLVTREDETVAAIWHDPALNTDPELVRAAAQAVLLTLDRQTASAELVASQARAVAAGDAERRRVERDLHDGAQQKLVALQIRVGLAREMAADDRSVAAAVGSDVAHGLEEPCQRPPRSLPGDPSPGAA